MKAGQIWAMLKEARTQGYYATGDPGILRTALFQLHLIILVGTKGQAHATGALTLALLC